MPFSAMVYNVLIASPSDVPEERQAIAQSIYEWNSLHSRVQGVILQPVMWETHSAPAMGDRPQGIINDQVVRECDMLIGAFWTRLGSPTGIEESGTVEEIKLFLNEKKPVMLYFSEAEVKLKSVDIDQYQKLENFKKSIRGKGIQESYGSVVELQQKLSRQLLIVMRDMKTAPVIDKRTEKAAKESAKDGLKATISAETFVASCSSKAKEEETWLEEYSEKAFIVRGNTIDYKDKLKEFGGRWITCRDKSKAWMFSKKRVEDVAKTLKVKPILRPVTC